MFENLKQNHIDRHMYGVDRRDVEDLYPIEPEETDGYTYTTLPCDLYGGKWSLDWQVSVW